MKDKYLLHNINEMKICWVIERFLIHLEVLGVEYP